MAHIVWISRGSYSEVIADYSGSPRHAALNYNAWQTEYNSGAAYSQMRTDHPGSQADVVDNVTIGKWKTDWSGPYVEPFEHFGLSSDAADDFDGVPAVDADGAQTHTLSIQKKDQDDQDVVTGSEPIRVIPSFPVALSSGSPVLSSGATSVIVGPSSSIGDVTIRVVDPAGTIKSREILIRFK